MTIFKGSRYEGVPRTGIRDLSGQTRDFLHDRRIFSAKDLEQNSFVHTLVGGEELDALAHRYYGDETLWYLIADVNDIFFMFDAQPGDELIIPDLSILNTRDMPRL